MNKNKTFVWRGWCSIERCGNIRAAYKRPCLTTRKSAHMELIAKLGSFLTVMVLYGNETPPEPVDQPSSAAIEEEEDWTLEFHKMCEVNERYRAELQNITSELEQKMMQCNLMIGAACGIALLFVLCKFRNVSGYLILVLLMGIAIRIDTLLQPWIACMHALVLMVLEVSSTLMSYFMLDYVFTAFFALVWVITMYNVVARVFVSMGWFDQLRLYFESVPICSICLQALVFEDDIERLNCRHAFHVRCINQWHQRTCPNCRMPRPVPRALH